MAEFGEQTLFIKASGHLREHGIIWLQYHCYHHPSFWFRRLPIPWATLVVTLSGPSWWRTSAENWSPFPRFALRGAATHWSEGCDVPSTYDEYLAVLLEPWAVQQIIGVSSAELCNRVLDLEDYLGGHATRVFDEISGARSVAEKVSKLVRAIAEWIAKGDSPLLPVELVVGCRSMAGSGRVSHLPALLGLSDRRLRNIFKDHLGVSAKRWALLTRFASRVRELHPSSWGARDDCDATTYADQAHEIHDFKRHAGITPGEYLQLKMDGDPRVFVVPSFPNATHVSREARLGRFARPAMVDSGHSRLQNGLGGQGAVGGFKTLKDEGAG